MKNFDLLTIEELRKVFDNNEKLQDDVLQAAQDEVCFWFNEYMECFDQGTIEYNIGYPGNYLKVKNRFAFIQGLFELQKNFCYLSDESDRKIKYCDHLIDRYNNLYHYDFTNAERLADRICDLSQELKTELLNNMVSEYNYYYDTKNLRDYFVEMYADNMTGQYYVDDDYILYQHIEYEKCYK